MPIQSFDSEPPDDALGSARSTAAPRPAEARGAGAKPAAPRRHADAIESRILAKGSGAGFRVISPFKLEDGSKILIDRGVIREQDTDRLESLGQQDIVIGYLLWPNETDYFTPDPNLERNIWFSRDLEKMASFLETQQILVVATENRLDPSLKMQDPTREIPNNHLQYAITWFMMSILWFGMSVYFVYKLIKKKKID